MAGPEPRVDAIVDKPNMPRILSLWVYLAVDSTGDEGVIGGNIGPGRSWVPFVGADKARMESLRPFAKKIAAHSGMEVRLVEFTQRIDHGVIGKER